MIDCKECHDYAHSIWVRGEIPITDIDKVALDRHILKGCESIKNNLTTVNGQTISIADFNKIPINIVCNGFVMKDVIIEVLNDFPMQFVNRSQDKEVIATKIQEAFAIKLGLKQGTI